jgi:hypothetical protein
MPARARRVTLAAQGESIDIVGFSGAGTARVTTGT